MKRVSPIFNIETDEGPIGISFLELTAAEGYCDSRNDAIKEFYAIKHRIPAPTKVHGQNYPPRPQLPSHLKSAMLAGTWDVKEETEWQVTLSKWQKLCEKADKELDQQYDLAMLKYNELFMAEVNKVKPVKLRKAILALVSGPGSRDHVYVSEGVLYS